MLLLLRTRDRMFIFSFGFLTLLKSIILSCRNWPLPIPIKISFVYDPPGPPKSANLLTIEGLEQEVSKDTGYCAMAIETENDYLTQSHHTLPLCGSNF
jgi:hypothetical protein